MKCPYCQALRAEDNTPCPYCGAHLPQAGSSTNNGWSPGRSGPVTEPPVSRGGPVTDAGGLDRSQFRPRLSMDPTSAWPQSFPPQHTPLPVGNSPSLLPVPYQNPLNLQSNVAGYTIPLQLISEHSIQHLMPGRPLQEEAVYIPPMFYQPRPLIPRYRVISGLLSVLIVFLFLCGGASYYAKTSGNLDAFSRFLTGTPPDSLQASSVQLPDPQMNPVTGPAYNVITSAALATRVDANNYAIQEVHIFKPGQTFYLTYSIQSPQVQGIVSTKWYTDNIYFTTVASNQAIPAGSHANGSVKMMYSRAAQGSVEIYWNKQLAQKLFFVVR